MEDSYDFSLSKSMASKSKTFTQEEESGWTSYFEDFLSSQRLLDQNTSISCTSYFGSTTTSCHISDAASYCAHSKPSSNKNSRIAAYSSGGHGLPNFNKKLNFKKTRTREIYRDDSLEDTASSPINSPKLGSFKKTDIDQRKRDENCESSLGKGGGIDHDLELERDGRVLVIVKTYLRKRGLSKSPSSMLMDYLG